MVSQFSSGEALVFRAQRKLNYEQLNSPCPRMTVPRTSLGYMIIDSTNLGSKHKYDVKVQGHSNWGDLNCQTSAGFWAWKAVLAVGMMIISMYVLLSWFCCHFRKHVNSFQRFKRHKCPQPLCPPQSESCAVDVMLTFYNLSSIREQSRGPHLGEIMIQRDRHVTTYVRNVI